MPMTAAVSPKQVGTRSRLPGTMVGWPPYTMATCAKSSECRHAGLLCRGGRNIVNDKRAGAPMLDMERREFIALIGGGVLLLAAKVRRARGQQPAMQPRVEA